MGVRKSVFGSKSERKNYEHLSRVWGDRYRIYHNLPFLNVLDVSNLLVWSSGRPKRITIDKRNLSRLKKTSIDFTVCDDNDSPLLCIEFDGMQDGFNVGDKYCTQLPSSPWREIIMDLKLKVAHASGLPFLVVGFAHFEHTARDTELTIVDGLVGDILASKEVSERLAQGFCPQDAGMSEEEFATLNSAQKHELIQDWVLSTEVDADFRHNPIYSVCANLNREIGHPSFSVQYLTYPCLDAVSDLGQRAKLMEEATMEGARVTVSHPILGRSTATVWLPNFKTPGISMLTLSQEIAHLIALDKLKQKQSSMIRE